jgi:putative FmdB family regulatory protein
MPIYEYHCADCRRTVSRFVMRISDSSTPTCPRCDGQRLTRLLSRFSRLRSEDDRLDALADPGALGDLDENDPSSVGRWMKKMGGELGEEAGDDWDEMVDEAVDQEESGGTGEGAGAVDAGDDL